MKEMVQMGEANLLMEGVTKTLLVEGGTKSGRTGSGRIGKSGREARRYGIGTTRRKVGTGGG